MQDGQEVVLRHSHPDVLSHYYKLPDIDEPVPLFAGDFSLRDGSSQDLDGDISFLWRPRPRVYARGSKNVDFKELHDMFSDDGDSEFWTDMAAVSLGATEGVPRAPAAYNPDRPQTKDYYKETSIGPFEVGGGPLDRVTFWIPNGWNATDGGLVCRPENLGYSWPSRLNLELNPWRLTIDRTRDAADSKFWDRLKTSGGRAVTHVGQLERSDGEEFQPQDITAPLSKLRTLVHFAVGRRTGPLLPVGWLKGQARWAQWVAPPIDPMSNVETFLDTHVATEQMRQFLTQAFGFCSTQYRWDVLHYATGYYLSANAHVDAEPAVSLAASGLQLLSHHRFVQEKQLYRTSAKFEDVANTEQQIRLLLEDCNIDTSIPDHFENLKRCAGLIEPQKPTRDGLGTVVYLRNKVVHPTKRMPNHWDIYTWVEASILARYFLRLAILNTVGYGGKIRSAISLNRYAGVVEPAPWNQTDEGG